MSKTRSCCQENKAEAPRPLSVLWAREKCIMSQRKTQRLFQLICIFPIRLLK